MTNIHPAAIVDNGAKLGENVEVGPYCVIGPNVIIGEGTRVMSHVVLDGRTKIGSNCTIFPFASIGTQTQDLKYKGGKTFVEIGDHTTIREYVTINSATNEGEITKVGSNCLLMAYSHVAHVCEVGNGVIMANCATLAGHVIVEDQAIIGGLSAVHQFVKIGRLCIIGGCTKVIQDCPPFMTIDGNPACVRGLNALGLKRRNIDKKVYKLLKESYKIMYRQGLSTTQALKKIETDLEECSEVKHFVSFIRKSERGVIK
ncbi:acyl-ACP--UDP-N-acetylglucosamine O-acyltransferase [Verrucomicrobiota bacterium]